MEPDRAHDTIAGLTPEQRALLMLRLQQRAAAREQHDPPAAIAPAGRDRDLPLSFAQRRIWFLYQSDGSNPAYNMPSAMRLTGRLDAATLAWSLNAVVARHEALRTTFATDGEEPRQVIAPALTIPLPLIDLRALAPAAREAQLRRISADLAWRAFDLARGPLIRAVLLRLGSDEHLLLTTIYHIVADGWSIGVLVRELAALYGARTSGRPSPLPDLPIQYADFAIWQRANVQGERLSAQLDYWRRQLAGLPALDLPTDRPRPAAQTYCGARRAFALTPDLSAAIRALGQPAGSTLFMTLLAAFDVLLARYTGQRDIVIGTPIAGRTRREIEPLIGCFVNTLALRADLRGDPPFRELMARVREVTLDAYAHQDLPFERLVDDLGIPRDPSRSPLFQVMFVLHNTPLPPLEAPGLTIESLDVDASTAKLDLWLSVVESPDQLCGHLEYNTDLFDASTIARMIGHFKVALADIAAAPDRRISGIALLTPAERQQILAEWSDARPESRSQAAGGSLLEVVATALGAPADRPRASAQIYLLDAHMQPVPIGVAGELYIFAETNDERRTTNDRRAPSFVFGRSSSIRLYKTGHSARYLPDGRIELMGRSDPNRAPHLPAAADVVHYARGSGEQA